MATLRAGEVSAAELHRARTRFALHVDFQQDSPADLCSWFGGAELFRPAESFEDRKRELQRVRLRDVQRAAQTWLTPERLVVVAVGPRAAKRAAERVVRRAGALLDGGRG